MHRDGTRISSRDLKSAVQLSPSRASASGRHGAKALVNVKDSSYSYICRAESPRDVNDMAKIRLNHHAASG